MDNVNTIIIIHYISLSQGITYDGQLHCNEICARSPYIWVDDLAAGLFSSSGSRERLSDQQFLR